MTEIRQGDPRRPLTEKSRIAAINTLDEEFSLLSNVDGAAISRLTLIKIKNVCFSLPPINIQQTIVQKLDALSAETKRQEAIYQQKLINLEELKKSVLQKAFNGEL